MLKFYFTLLIGVLLHSCCIAQSYTNIDSTTHDHSTAFGVRVAEPLGISFKQYIKRRNSLEAVVGVEMRGFYSAILWEYDLVKTKRNGILYTGLGPNYIKWNKTDETFYKYPTGETYGIVAILGYGQFCLIKNIPLLFSLDWMPRYDLSGNNKDTFYFGQYGFSVRYVFR